MSAYVKNVVKTHFLRNQLLKACDFFSITVKKLKKTCSSTGGAPASKHLYLRHYKLKRVHVADQILQPKRSAFTQGGWLCRLKMRVGKGWKRFIFQCEAGQLYDDPGKGGSDLKKGFLHQN